MADKYPLSRDTQESKRLDDTHDLIGRTLEYQIAPWIREKTPPDAQIADVATGTAAWLRNLSENLPKSVELHGWDISDEQYPNDLPGNVTLHVHDAMHSFPEAYHGRFHVVHIRLLSSAMDEADWETVARHCFELLRPGGWIQWDECDASLAGYELRGRLGASNGSIGVLVRKSLELWSSGTTGYQNIPEALKKVGFVNVDSDKVCSDRVLEDRDAWTNSLIEAARGVLLNFKPRGKENTWTDEKVKAEVEVAHKDRLSVMP